VKKIVALLFLMASASFAADVHFTWLPFSSNILVAPQTATTSTKYGVNVLIDSDNVYVSDFSVTLVVKLADEQIKTFSGTVARNRKAGGVAYSTNYSTWIDTDPNFQILAIEVKAIAGVSVTRPAAGRDYGNEQ
jgi:hypothetical protein